MEKDTVGEVDGASTKAQLLREEALRAEENSSEVNLEPAQGSRVASSKPH